MAAPPAVMRRIQGALQPGAEEKRLKRKGTGHTMLCNPRAQPPADSSARWSSNSHGRGDADGKHAGSSFLS